MTSISILQWVHANICVRDMERTVPFYEMLGFEAFADQIFGEGAEVWPGLGLPQGRRFRAVFMKIPGDHPVPFLDIIEFLDPKTAGEAYPTLHNVGIGRLCFEVADIDAAAAFLVERGVELVAPVARYEVGPGVRPHGVDARFLCFKDPDGTIIEYVQFGGAAQDVVTAAAPAVGQR